MADVESDQLESKSIGILYFVVGFIGVLSNSLVIRVFYRDGIFDKARNILHINLAFANMLVVACFPFSGLSSFYGKWLFGPVGCKIYGVESFTAGIGSLSFVLMLCVERYWANCRTSMYDSMSPKTMWFVAALVWLHALAWAVFPLIGWSSYSVEPSSVACGLDWLSHSYSHASYASVMIAEFTLFFAVAGLSVNAAKNAGCVKKIDASGIEWFSEKQLVWISYTFLLIAAIGWSPYMYFAIWTLNSEIKTVTVLAATIPPLISKASVAFYAIPYLVANERFRDIFIGQPVLEAKPKAQ